VFDLGESWSDFEIWRYAQENDLVIVTKDADFSDWVMLSEPPPKVIPADWQYENAGFPSIHPKDLA